MPVNYQDAYKCLQKASEDFRSLPEKETQEERYACLRVAFLHMYEAIDIASKCYEASNWNGSDAQGGTYEQVRSEASDFFYASKHCRTLLSSHSEEEVGAACEQWLERAKGFVDKVRTQEAKETNLQYARMPEQQDYSIITKKYYEY